MAQRMAKICLFTSFLLSQFLITSLTSSQVVASILVLTDAQRDLEEVEKLHEDERQFASQFDAERFGSTCLLYTSPSPRDATLSRMPSSA